MSFIKYLMMKSENSGGFRFWRLIFFILIAISIKFPPFSVLIVGILIRQYQNYLEYISYEGAEDSMRSGGGFSKILKAIMPVFYLVFSVGFIIFANWILKNNARTGNGILGVIMLMIFFFFYSFAEKLKSTAEKMDGNVEEYNYKNKYEVAENLKKINFKKLNQQGRKESAMSASSDVSGESQMLSQNQNAYFKQELPKNINPKLYIKPKVKAPNVVAFNGSKPITLLDKEYADQVIAEFELRRENDRELIDAVKKAQMSQSINDPSRAYVGQPVITQSQQSSMAQSEQPRREPLPQQAFTTVKPVVPQRMDSKNYSSYKSDLKQYERKLEKEQKIKGQSSWFGVIKACPVCGGKSKISRNNKQFCEFCGMEID